MSCNRLCEFEITVQHTPLESEKQESEFSLDFLSRSQDHMFIYRLKNTIFSEMLYLCNVGKWNSLVGKDDVKDVKLTFLTISKVVTSALRASYCNHVGH